MVCSGCERRRAKMLEFYNESKRKLQEAIDYIAGTGAERPIDSDDAKSDRNHHAAEQRHDRDAR